MRRVPLYVVLVLLLGLATISYPKVFAANGTRTAPLASSLFLANGNGAASSSAQPKLPPGYVGAAVCEPCHTDIAHSFANNPHARMVLLHGDDGLSCENCHGPGLAHVESGGNVTKIFRFEDATPRAIDMRCLHCHENAHPNFMRSPHARAGVDCLSCHSVHHAGVSQNLLIAPQPELCYRCHTDVEAQFSMPFHHPVNEGVMKCSDCHDVHGTFSDDNLRSTADANAVCTRCHTDVRGPFVFEHAAVKGVGCLGCHNPHGSENPRMLTMASVNTLCNQCHSPVSSGTFHSMGAGSTELTPCTDCHTMIHGSNLNAAFLK